MLYNGRNDLAEAMVNLLLNQIEEGKKVNFDLGSGEGRACFGDFIARTAAELTPQVGPPYYTLLISPENRVERIKHAINQSLNPDHVKVALRLLFHPIEGGGPLLSISTEMKAVDIDMDLPKFKPKEIY
jgi:hypothetical protein